MNRLALRSLRAPSRILSRPQALGGATQRRFISKGEDSESTPNEALDALSDRPVKGRTGGGDKLESSSPNAPPKPKVSNLSMPGVDDPANLTKEQQAEVDEHNRDFDKKHDRSAPAADDLVNKKFWEGDPGSRSDKK